jgi:hypothetical protein
VVPQFYENEVVSISNTAQDRLTLIEREIDKLSVQQRFTSPEGRERKTLFLFYCKNVRNVKKNNQKSASLFPNVEH